MDIIDISQLLITKRFPTESGEPYGCIMLDVDCKDRSLGISCPPPSFLDPIFIESVKQSLNPHGE